MRSPPEIYPDYSIGHPLNNRGLMFCLQTVSDMESSSEVQHNAKSNDYSRKSPSQNAILDEDLSGVWWLPTCVSH